MAEVGTHYVTDYGSKNLAKMLFFELFPAVTLGEGGSSTNQIKFNVELLRMRKLVFETEIINRLYHFNELQRIDR